VTDAADPTEIAAASPERTARPMSPRERLLELIKARAILHGRVTLSSGREADYYVDLRRITLVVRKSGKAHGLQQRIEGPSITGRRVLIVEDTTTTGASPLDAVAAARQEGAEVVAVATIADRATGAKEKLEAQGLTYITAYSLQELGLV
jgi:orotate phosphoribosyltransferase